MTDNKEQKQKTAVALEYSKDEPAPKIIASGKGYVAEQIIKTGQENNVPIHKDAGLASTLSKMDIGEYIPESMYGIVAEVLVMVDRAEKKVKGKSFVKK